MARPGEHDPDTTDQDPPVPATAEAPAPEDVPATTASGDAPSSGAARSSTDDASSDAPAPVDAAERERLDAVRSTGLVGVEAGERLDRVARQASQVTGTPIALVSLVDEDRQWNPGVHGEGAPREAPRAFSMCSRAIETPEPFVVEDASKDPEWSAVPGVSGPPGVRFYAGQPIDDGDGHLIGVLCVIDTVPREADEELLASLRDLAVWARHELLAAPRAAAPAPATEADASAAEATASAAGPTAPGDDDRQATTDRLQELERLQSLVVSTTAHELRTPLTVLRVHAEMLQAAAEDLGPDERASLEAIAGAVSRLQDVSDGLVSDLRGSAGGAEEALRRWLRLEQGSERVRPVNEPDGDED